jgi:hypothetical protein
MALKDSRIHVAFRISFDLYMRDEGSLLLVPWIDLTDAARFGPSVRGVLRYALRSRVIMGSLVCTQTKQLQDAEKLIFGLPDDQKFNSYTFYSVFNATLHFFFICVVGGGIKVHSTLRPLNGLLCQPRVIMMIIEKLVEWLAGETEVLEENLPQCPFVHHKSHMLPVREPGPPRWEASV